MSYFLGGGINLVFFLCGSVLKVHRENTSMWEFFKNIIKSISIYIYIFFKGDKLGYVGTRPSYVPVCKKVQSLLIRNWLFNLI